MKVLKNMGSVPPPAPSGAMTVLKDRERTTTDTGPAPTDAKLAGPQCTERESKRGSPNDRWITFMAMVVVAAIGVASSFYLRYLETKDRIKHEVLQERKAALFDALRVVDFVYANTGFSDGPPLTSTKWDIQLARDAMNRMLIYCDRPESTVKTFMRAIGVPEPGKPYPPINPALINDFRREAARELGQPIAAYDPSRAWIYTMPGTREDSILKAQRVRQALRR